jgi:hypothetical protein
MPMTVLICGSPASGFQIIGPFANSADAQSYAEDYSLKDWWVAELISPGAFAEEPSGDGFLAAMNKSLAQMNKSPKWLLALSKK